MTNVAFQFLSVFAIFVLSKQRGSYTERITTVLTYVCFFASIVMILTLITLYSGLIIESEGKVLPLVNYAVDN